MTLPIGLTTRGWNLGRAMGLLRLLLDEKATILTSGKFGSDALLELKQYAGIALGLRDVIEAEPDVAAIRGTFKNAFEDVKDLATEKVVEVPNEGLKNGKLVAVLRFEMHVEGAHIPLHETKFGVRDSTKEGAELVKRRIHTALMTRTAEGPLVDAILVTFPPKAVRGFTVHDGGKGNEGSPAASEGTPS